jgi:hypothetical protein
VRNSNRQRFVKYMGYYVALVAVLLIVRFSTRGSESTLQDLGQTADELVTERSQLRREIASLESPARVREWAVQNKMVPFTAAKTEAGTLQPLEAAPVLKPVREKLKVITQWR